MADRRDFLKLGVAAAAFAAADAGAAQASTPGTTADTDARRRAIDVARGHGGLAARNTPRWISTTQAAPWRELGGVSIGPVPANPFETHVELLPDATRQTVRGFGGAFSEKGWLALQSLPATERDTVLDLLFAPGRGASLTMGRTPIGANDIARGWYSYDETDGDFALEHFSVANDRDTLIPFIRAALARQPDMTLWASPWSPPTWMKTNRHYAMAPAWPGQPSNGIRPDQLGREGRDHFVLETAYLDAYARYFRRYVESYAAEGIRISHVMPQNEFNSAQPFPSCCWTPQGLARFIPHLAREMGPLGVQVFFGTLERGDVKMLEAVRADPVAGPLLRGIGVQWAGRGALPEIRAHHADLELWHSEQECGFGTNDWRYARHIWGRMKEYFQAGASAWFYWNLAMPEGGLSTWGWPQNSLFTIDEARGRWRPTHEFWLLAHASAFVSSGARRIEANSFMGYENLLAFRNADGSIVVLMQNGMSAPMDVRMKVGAQSVALRLPADSFNTLVLPGSATGVA